MKARKPARRACDFAPLEPVVLMGHLRPEPWDIGTPVADRLAEVAAGLPTLRAIVALDDEPAPSGLRKPLYRFADLIVRAAAAERNTPGQTPNGSSPIALTIAQTFTALSLFFLSYAARTQGPR